MSVFTGFDNAVATGEMSPQELAPTSSAQLQWPKWGEYFSTKGKSGEPVDVPEAAAQLERYQSWLGAATPEDRASLWQSMLEEYSNQVFSIGTVNNARQPVVVSAKLRNVPADGIFTWEPTAYFGVYRPDTFWFDK
jgi:peptide/nickel transport system substrate-binding protein